MLLWSSGVSARGQVIHQSAKQGKNFQQDLRNAGTIRTNYGMFF